MPVNGEPAPERQFGAYTELKRPRTYLQDNEPVEIRGDLAGQDTHPDSKQARQQAWEAHRQKLANPQSAQPEEPEVTHNSSERFPIPGFHSWPEVYAGTAYVATRAEIPEQVGRLSLLDQTPKSA